MYFSTRNVERPDRRQAWQASVAGHCGAFTMEHKPEAFDASIEVRQLAPLHCSRVMQTSGTAQRRAREIEIRPLPKSLLILQISGASRMEQLNRAADLQPDDLTIIAMMQPSCFSFDGRSVQLSLHLLQWMIDAPCDWTAKLATSLPKTPATLVAPLIRAAFDEIRITAEGLTAIGKGVVNLVGAGWMVESETHSTREAELPQALRAVQGHILGNLDQDLTPYEIAHACGISERSLHRLFESYGTSVSRWIRQNRLDRCAAELVSPRSSYKSVTEIAFGWGFNDCAHFSRAFRDQFNRSPSAFRVSHRGSLAHPVGHA